MVNNTYQITTRTVGALQMTGGALGVGASVAASPIACATGIGCVADAGLIILSADSAYTGSKQLVTGIPQNTIFNKALQGLGLSPQAAAYLEAVVGVGTTVVASSPAIQKAITSAANTSAAEVGTTPAANVAPVTSGGTANLVSGARLDMQLSAEQAAGTNAPTSITSYSDHAIAQSVGRDGGIGVSQAAVNDAFANPVQIQYVPSQYGPTFKYVGQNATVVVNAQGNVVTAWGTSATGVAK